MTNLLAPSLPVCTAALMLTALCGCAEFEFMKWKKEQVPLVATAEQPAVECLCVWQSAEGRGVRGLPSRGFAGQILFFTRNNPSPVEVEGDVRVYVFDDQGTPEERAKPIHQFDFTPEVWQSHVHQGMLGTTYNVFIPYTRKGDHQAQCALRLRMTPRGGAPVYSETANVTLPGKLDEAKAAAETQAEATKMAQAVQQRLGPLAQQPAKTNVSTIPTAPSPIAPGVPNAAPVAPVHGATPQSGSDPSAVDPAAQRLAHVEQMLARLLDDKSAALAPAPANAANSPAAPAGSPSRRFKLHASAAGGTGDVDDWWDERSFSAPQPLDTAPQETSRRAVNRHPLAEDPAPRRATNAWPIEPVEELAIGRLK